MSCSILDAISHNRDTQCNAPAVSSFEQTWSYSKLLDETERIARNLARLTSPGDTIALVGQRDPSFVASILGIWQAGCVYAPVDRTLPSARQEKIIKSVDPSIVVYTCDSEPALAGQTLIPIAKARQPILDNEDQRINSSPVINEPFHSPAYMMCTSGSTGAPNAVLVSHGALLNLLYEMIDRIGISRRDQFLAITNASFDISLLEILAPLLVGAHLHIVDGDSESSATKVIRALETRRFSTMQATPALWEMLLRAAPNTEFPQKRICGGDKLSVDVAQRLTAEQTETWNCYGPTETTIWSSVYKVLGDEKVAVPIGQPIKNTQFHVLDEQMEPVECGEIGDLWIAGDGLALGYWRNPALTANCFLPNPFSSGNGERMYHTGDKVRLRPDAGEYEFLGRNGGYLKVAGHRIELGEIESALNEKAAVQKAVVVAAETASESPKIMAAWCREPNHEAQNSISLLEALKKDVPAYMLPVAMYELPSLPLTPNGKIDRNKVQSWLLSQSATPTPNDLADDLEKAIGSIWSEVLGKKCGDRNKSFFEMGGTSLNAAKLVGLIEERLQLRLELHLAFEAPTIAQMALNLKPLPKVSVSPTEEHPSFSHIQEIFWAKTLFSPDGYQDLVCELFQVEGIKSAEKFKSAVEAALREIDVIWMEWPTDPESISTTGDRRVIWSEHSVQELTEREREPKAQGIFRDIVFSPFDLQAAPLFSVILIKMDAGRYWFGLKFMHILLDNASIPMILKRIGDHYDAVEPKYESDSAFFEYVRWQRSNYTEETCSEALNYWRSRFNQRQDVSFGLSSEDEAKTDKKLEIELTEMETRAVYDAAEQRSTTPFLIGLTSLAIALGKLRGERGITRIDFFIFDRFGPGLSDVVGPLMDGMCVVVENAPSDSFKSTFKKIEAEYHNGLRHKEVPLTSFVAELLLSANVSFNWIYKGDPPQIPGLKVSYASQESLMESFPFPFHLEVVSSAQSLKARFFYDSSHVRQEDVAKLAFHWKNSVCEKSIALT